MLNNWWFTTGSGGGFGVVPAGLIVPFNGATDSLPADTERFLFAEARLLRGGTTSGVEGGTLTASVRSSYTGSHSGTNNVQMVIKNSTSISNPNYISTNATRGNHGHSIIATYSPPTQEQVFIKTTAEMAKFPAGVAVLADSSFSNLDNFTPNGYLLGMAIGDMSIGTAEISSGISVADGNHNHHHGTAGTNTSSNATRYYQSDSGTHNHTLNLSITCMPSRFYMGMWGKAAEEFRLEEGMFALWESLTPPEGWSICDGTNGTPDLTDTFIGLDDSILGQMEGDDTINFSGSLLNGGTHNHTKITVSAPGQLGPHGTGYAHSHTIASGDISFIPRNYTIIFIKFTG